MYNIYIYKMLYSRTEWAEIFIGAYNLSFLSYSFIPLIDIKCSPLGLLRSCTMVTNLK